MTNPITVKLTTPIEALGETRTALTFRPLTGADLEASGYPLVLAGDETTTPIPKAINVLISRLAGVPPSSVKAMAAADWNNCMAAVLSFFAPAGAISTPAETATPTN